MTSDLGSAGGPASSGVRPDFTSIYRSEVVYVWHTVRRLGVREADLEDAVHDVFVVVHRRLGDYDPARPIRPWLFGISLRVAAAFRRRRGESLGGPELDIADPRPGPDEALVARRARQVLLEALGQLDLDQRAVFILHDIDGQSAPEIADALATPLNTVYSRLRLARAKMAAATARAKLRACGA